MHLTFLIIYYQDFIQIVIRKHRYISIVHFQTYLYLIVHFIYRDVTSRVNYRFFYIITGILNRSSGLSRRDF